MFAKPTAHERFTLPATVEQLILAASLFWALSANRLFLGAALKDRDLSAPGTWGFAAGWAVGLRAETATGSGQSYDPGSQTFGTASDPWRAERFRISPILTYKPSEFSRIRLQVADDRARPDGTRDRQLFLQYQMSLGAHGAHAF